MAIEYKEITQLEKLDELADGSYIMVVQDGTAKLISKENAKFGGGSTTFYAVENSASGQSASGDSSIAVQASVGPSYTFQHSDGTEVTAQEAYDAYIAGGVRFAFTDYGEYWVNVITMNWRDSNNKQLDPANVACVRYGCFLGNAVETIQIGQDPFTD